MNKDELSSLAFAASIYNSNCSTKQDFLKKLMSLYGNYSYKNAIKSMIDKNPNRQANTAINWAKNFWN